LVGLTQSFRRYEDEPFKGILFFITLTELASLCKIILKFLPKRATTGFPDNKMHEIASGSIKSIEAPIASRIINDLVLNAVLAYHQLSYKPLRGVGISLFLQSEPIEKAKRF
jgi:hypothetical protein